MVGVLPFPKSESDGLIVGSG